MQLATLAAVRNRIRLGEPMPFDVRDADRTLLLARGQLLHSQAQLDAQKLAQDFSAGTGNASLQDVMMSLQKANLSFQQMVQVRNKLVSAYQDIMNMPV